MQPSETSKAPPNRSQNECHGWRGGMPKDRGREGRNIQSHAPWWCLLNSCRTSYVGRQWPTLVGGVVVASWLSAFLQFMQYFNFVFATLPTTESILVRPAYFISRRSKCRSGRIGRSRWHETESGSHGNLWTEIKTKQMSQQQRSKCIPFFLPLPLLSCQSCLSRHQHHPSAVLT